MAHSQEFHSLSNPLKHQPPQVDDQGEDSFNYAMHLANLAGISMALQAVLELGVLDVIHRAGPNAGLSAAEIASELSCKNPKAPSSLDRLLRVLADHSVLHCSVVTDENQEMGCLRRLYGLTPVGKFFLSNVPGGSLGPLLTLNQCQRCLSSWAHMKDAILEGDIAFKRANGSHAYECTGLDPRFGEVFQVAMVNYTTILMNQILERYKGFKDITTLVDVGGGLGITVNMITSKYPHIRGINFDLPHVIHNAPLYPRVAHVGGDMFESVPKGDAIFMRWILQDWSDEECLKLLKNCYNAIPKNGKVIAVNGVLKIEPDSSLTTKVTNQFDIILMNYDGGRERSEQEFLNLATSAGFSGIRLECFVYGVWVIEFFK